MGSLEGQTGMEWQAEILKFLPRKVLLKLGPRGRILNPGMEKLGGEFGGISRNPNIYKRQNIDQLFLQQGAGHIRGSGALFFCLKLLSFPSCWVIPFSFSGKY